MNKLATKLTVKNNPSLTYELALEKARLYDQILAGLSVDDWVWQDLHSKRYEAYRLCEAFDVHLELGEIRHLQPVKVLYSYNKGVVTEEKTLYINRNLGASAVLRAITTEIQTQLCREGVMYKYYMDLEVILL